MVSIISIPEVVVLSTLPLSRMATRLMFMILLDM